MAVRAYSVTLGAAGNVGVDAISRLPVRIAGVSGVTNPFRAEGGAAAEEPAAAIGTGPAMIKTRGRAVSTGDMALLERFIAGEDYRTRAVKVSASGRLRNELQRHPRRPVQLDQVVETHGSPGRDRRS